MWSNFDEVIKIQILIKEQIFCLPMEFNYQLPLYDQKKFTWRQSFGRTLIFKTCLERK